MGVRIAWGITGAGDFLSETISFMEKVKDRYDLEVHVYLSKEANYVLRFYGLIDRVKGVFREVSVERSPNVPRLPGRLHVNRYKLLLIAPATANTVAKIAYGIADSLISNSAAQAMKARVPVYILPTDQKEGERVSKLPDGTEIRIRIRKEDVENVERLRRMEGITVLERIEEMEEVFKKESP
ncbi:MAG: archaeoflavoprotein AfpA [Candidatus Methanospirareceae archaeon]